MLLRALAALLLLSGLWAGPGWAAGLLTEPMRLPVTLPEARGDESVALEALLIRPEGPGPFPLAVINHGTPRDPAERRTRRPMSFQRQAEEFARRGWAALVLMRRAYGQSEGEYAETIGPCNTPDYVTSGRRSADDIRAAIRFMAAKPYIDRQRIISVGVSAGGLATVALTADPPPGLVAAISFAGGRGSPSNGVVCTEARLVDAFRSFGQRSRVPMLWLYAENDRFFGPALAKQLAAAFTGAGGKAQYVAMPPSGEDGHSLFTRGVPEWIPFVDRFLAAHSLPHTVSVIVRPPPSLSGKGLEAFATYQTASGHRAFAVSPGGGYGWRTGSPSPEDASTGALDFCEKAAKRKCRLYMLDGRTVE